MSVMKDRKRKMECDMEELEKLVFSESDSSLSTDIEEKEELKNKHHQGTSESVSVERGVEDAMDECVWHDSEDDDDPTLSVNLQENPKLRKLKFFGDPEATKVSIGNLHKRLKAYKLRKLKQVDWVAGLHKKNATETSGAKKLHGIDLGSNERMDLEFLKTTKRILGVSDSSTTLPSGKLQYYFQPDLNRHSFSKSAVTACGFLDDHELFFCSGPDKSIRLFKTSSPQHEKRAVYHMKNKSIKSAWPLKSSYHPPSILFLAGIRSVGILDVETGGVSMLRSISSHKRHSHFFQLACGEGPNVFAMTSSNGYIFCCDSRTQCVEMTFRMKSEGHALTYVSQDDRHLCSGDDQGIVYDWDIRANRCYEQFRDQGSSCVTSLAACTSWQSMYLAVGGNDGIVNLYNKPFTAHEQNKSQIESSQAGGISFFDDMDFRDTTQASLHCSEEKSIWNFTKSFHHLTTSISSLAFHPSNDLLAMVSKYKRDAVRLVHLPSLTVYSNFPRQNQSTQIKYPECLCFNEKGSSFVIGNSHGHAKHIELLHFSRSQRGKLCR